MIWVAAYVAVVTAFIWFAHQHETFAHTFDHRADKPREGQVRGFDQFHGSAE